MFCAPVKLDLVVTRQRLPYANRQRHSLLDGDTEAILELAEHLGVEGSTDRQGESAVVLGQRNNLMSESHVGGHKSKRRGIGRGESPRGDRRQAVDVGQHLDNSAFARRAQFQQIGDQVSPMKHLPIDSLLDGLRGSGLAPNDR